MGFEAVISKTTDFKDCVDAIAVLINEGTFEISKDGLRLRAMAPSQIAMVDFELDKKFFESYVLDGSFTMSVDLEEFNKIIKRASPRDKILLKLSPESSRLMIVLKGESTRTFYQPLIEAVSTSPNMPSLEFTSVITVTAGMLKEALKDVALVASHVVLEGKSGGLFINATSDTGEVNIQAVKDQKNVLAVKVDSEARAMYPLEYMEDMILAATPETEVTLSMKTDAPLRIDYNIAEARLTYFLAPRIESV